MTASSNGTIPRRVRVDAAMPAPWRTLADASVVHLGQSALIIADRRGQLLMTSERFGLAPGGLQLEGADFAAVRSEFSRGIVRVADWRPEIVEPVDLTLRPARIDAAAARMLSAAVESTARVGIFDASRQRSAAPALAASAIAGEPIGGALLGLIGAGPGSTPAGDDVIVGVLAGLVATDRGDAAAVVASATRPLLARTTSASRHYLAAAADGRFAERVHWLVSGLRDEAGAMDAVTAAAQWGATSGLDLLSGIAAVASADISTSSRRVA